MLIYVVMNLYFVDKEKRKFTVSIFVKREVFGFLYIKFWYNYVGCYSMYFLFILLEFYRVKKYNIVLVD